MAQIRAALETVHDALVRTREELAMLLRQPLQLAAIEGKLDEMLAAARAPKVAKTYHVGLGNWSLGTSAIVGFIVIVVGMFRS